MVLLHPNTTNLLIIHVESYYFFHSQAKAEKRYIEDYVFVKLMPLFNISIER